MNSIANSNKAKARDIVSAILANLKGRRGVGDELDQIDYDVYLDMINELMGITVGVLEGENA